MPGPLPHPPARVLQAALILKGWASDPEALPLGPWPVYQPGEPDAPDDCLTVRGTTGRTTDGRAMIDGSRFIQHGFQLRVRALDEADGYAKAQELADHLDRDLYQYPVVVEGTRYLIHAVVSRGDVLELGPEEPTSRRSLFTLNAFLVVDLN